MKKQLVLTMILLMILPLVFAACTTDPQGAENLTTTAPTETPEGETSILDTLPVVDYQNREVTILSFSGTELINYEDTSTPLSKATFDRTMFLNDFLNCEIQIIIQNDTLKYIEANHLGGGVNNYDLVNPHVSEGLAATLTSGYLANLLTVSTMSLDKEWYYQNLIQNYQINGKLYLEASSFGQGGGRAIVFNKALYQTMGGTADLYQIADDGDWTIEFFLNEMKNLEVDGENTFAFVFNYQDYNTFFFYGFDIQTAAKGDGDEWTLTFNTKDNMDRIDRMLAYTHDMLDNVKLLECANTEGGNKRAWYYAEQVNSGIFNYFLTEKSVFQLIDVGSFYSVLLEAEFDVGYLPCPKLDTLQDDYYMQGQATQAIPSILSAEQREMSGAVWEAIARWSYINYRPVFYEMVIGGRMSENPDDYEALCRIFDPEHINGNIVERFAYTNFTDITKALPETCSTSISSRLPVFKMILQQANTVGSDD